jgi:hypothetical protein
VLWLLESCFVVQEACFSTIQAKFFVVKHSSYSQIEDRFIQHTCSKTCKCSLAMKEDYLLDFVDHSSWRRRSLEIPLCCWRLAIAFELSWTIDFATMFFFLWATCSKDKGSKKKEEVEYGKEGGRWEWKGTWWVNRRGTSVESWEHFKYIHVTLPLS